MTRPGLAPSHDRGHRPPPARRVAREHDWPTMSSISVNASIRVATALVAGVTPRLIWPKTYSGRVDDPRPFTNDVIR